MRELAAAINGKTADARRALLHSRSVPCTTGDAAPLYEHMVTRQAREPMPANARWSLRPLPPDRALMFDDKFDYPVRPTHLLQIDVDRGGNRSTTMILQLAQEAGRWREVVPCPKPETIVEARAAAQERAKREERVRALAAQVAPDVRASVVKLYKDGRRIEAIREYARLSGEELAIAKAVVELLAGEPR